METPCPHTKYIFIFDFRLLCFMLERVMDDLASSLSFLKECCAPEYRLDLKPNQSSTELLLSSPRPGQSTSRQSKTIPAEVRPVQEKGTKPDRDLLLSRNTEASSMKAKESYGTTSFHVTTQNGSYKIFEVRFLPLLEAF